VQKRIKATIDLVARGVRCVEMAASHLAHPMPANSRVHTVPMTQPGGLVLGWRGGEDGGGCDGARKTIARLVASAVKTAEPTFRASERLECWSKADISRKYDVGKYRGGRGEGSYSHSLTGPTRDGSSRDLLSL
jgi:hypothetical protein